MYIYEGGESSRATVVRGLNAVTTDKEVIELDQPPSK